MQLEPMAQASWLGIAKELMAKERELHTKERHLKDINELRESVQQLKEALAQRLCSEGDAPGAADDLGEAPSESERKLKRDPSESALSVGSVGSHASRGAEGGEENDPNQVLVSLEEEKMGAGQTTSKATAVRKALADLPTPIHLIGLCRLADIHVLRLELFKAAFKPDTEASFTLARRGSVREHIDILTGSGASSVASCGAGSISGSAPSGGSPYGRGLRRRKTISHMLERVRPFNELDRSTWLYRHLEVLSPPTATWMADGSEEEGKRCMRELLRLQRFAGHDYRCLINQYILVLPLKKSNNIYPLNDYVRAPPPAQILPPPPTPTPPSMAAHG